MKPMTQHSVQRPLHRSYLLLACLLGGAPLARAGQNSEGPAGATTTAEGAAEGEVKLTAAAIEANGIQVGRATLQVLTPTFTAAARVTFNGEGIAHVGTPLAGRAVELKVRRGESVKRDDELIVIESPEFGQAQSEFLQRRTAARIAGIAVEPLRGAYERARRLYDLSKGVALAEVQRREMEYRTAEGALETAKAAVVAGENSLRLMGMSRASIAALAETGEINPRFSVRAPVSGQVIARDVTLGEHVSPEREALLVVADTDTMWVLADVPEARLAELAVGSRARVTLALPGSEALLENVAFIDSAVSQRTRCVSVRIEVQNRGGTLRPGTFAQAEFSAGGRAQSEKPVLVVPEEAIQTVDGASVVFAPVAGKANTFAKRPVVVGAAAGGMVRVISGLEENASVVIAGSFIFKAELGKGSGEGD